MLKQVQHHLFILTTLPPLGSGRVATIEAASGRRSYVMHGVQARGLGIIATRLEPSGGGR
jgi:hypothetical protein